MIWILMFVGAALASVFGIIYMTNSIAKFKMIKNRLVAFLIIVALFVIFIFTLEWINALTITIYTTAFFLIFGLLGRIVNHFSKREFKIHWQGLLAILSSVIFLGSGYYLCASVVEKDYDLTTVKEIGDLKIAMLSDSHIGTTFDGEGFAKHLKTIEAQSPDILLIVGDFVDDSSKKADLEIACKTIGEMDLKYGAWYAYGNHDRGYFDHRDFTAEDLENTLLKNGINILEDESVLIDDRFYLVGRADKGYNHNRMTIDELLQDMDTSKYIIVMDHEPADYDAEAQSAADLVLCGHTHGGQMIPITKFGVWSGIDDSTYGLEKHNNTNFIVSSGISDWAIKFKTGTRSEYVVVNLSSEK
ncbi:MAG: metallophosphoesterase [Pseudobutyrivibrio sp.]|nr:metallophosphoesterase [Pseudobutyrivibrio sp.]